MSKIHDIIHLYIIYYIDIWMMYLIQKAEYEIFLIMETIRFMYEKMNKLVRDNIPNIIEQQGDNPDFVILDSIDYYNELKKKLTEELTEFNISDDVLELCDLVEVISAILDYKNINNKEFEEMRLKKNKINGKFKNKIFLNGIHRMS